jgi:hypothetical protein
MRSGAISMLVLPHEFICRHRIRRQPRGHAESAEGESLRVVLMGDRASDSERIDHQPVGEHCEPAVQEYSKRRQAPPRRGACSEMT